jgi:CBS domain-containing protein
MGTQSHSLTFDDEQRRVFMQHLLGDLRALELMIERDMFETGVRRIGAEQELALVDPAGEPAPVAVELMRLIDDPHMTYEIGRFNLEINLDPIALGRGSLQTMQAQLENLLRVVRDSCHQFACRPILVGILPTLKLSDLTHRNIVPEPRYLALDEMIRRFRGTDYELSIKGTDELTVRHHSVMLEAVNTSFQLHYQVGPDEFARHYNIAQAIAGPLLSASVNSPVLFGKRLWRETRIALFQQAVDTRAKNSPERDLLARVRFGEAWVQDSVLELFRHDVARFRVFFADGECDDSVELLEHGQVPRLRALQAHNGTVYRWNRACYGITDGRPHLRIENRVLPAGPTVIDQMANAAFWFGLMVQAPREWPDVHERLDFDDARNNFLGAARTGLNTQFQWLDGRTVPADTLILDDLIPMARLGLERVDVDGDDLLDIVEQRVASRKTGSAWLLGSVNAMKDHGTRAQRLGCLTRTMLARQTKGDPVHTWTPASFDECGDWAMIYARVGQFMSTSLHTIGAKEPIDLAAAIMDWQHVRHVPVENENHELVGLVTYRSLIHMLAQQSGSPQPSTVPVEKIMTTDLITATPSTPTLEAIELMRAHNVSCLPVIEDGALVGMVTEHDFMRIAGQLLERRLRGE